MARSWGGKIKMEMVLKAGGSPRAFNAALYILAPLQRECRRIALISGKEGEKVRTADDDDKVSFQIDQKVSPEGHDDDGEGGFSAIYFPSSFPLALSIKK